MPLSSPSSVSGHKPLTIADLKAADCSSSSEEESKGDRAVNTPPTSKLVGPRQPRARPKPPPSANTGKRKSEPDELTRGRRTKRRKKRRKKKNVGSDRLQQEKPQSEDVEDEDDFVVTSPIYEPILPSDKESVPGSPVSVPQSPDSDGVQEVKILPNKKEQTKPTKEDSPVDVDFVFESRKPSDDEAVTATKNKPEIVDLAADSDTDPDLMLSCGSEAEDPQSPLRSPDVAEVNDFLSQNYRKKSEFTAGGYATSPIWEDSPGALSPEYSPKSSSSPCSSPRSPPPFDFSPGKANEGLVKLLNKYSQRNLKPQTHVFHSQIVEKLSRKEKELIQELSREKAELDARYPSSPAHAKGFPTPAAPPPPRPPHSFPPTSPYHHEDVNLRACPVRFQKSVPTNDTRLKKPLAPGFRPFIPSFKPEPPPARKPLLEPAFRMGETMEELKQQVTSFKKMSTMLREKLRTLKWRKTKEITELKSLLLKAKMDFRLFKDKIERKKRQREEERLRRKRGGTRKTNGSKHLYKKRRKQESNNLT